MNKKNSCTIALLAILTLNISFAQAQSPATQKTVNPQASSQPVVGSGTAGQITKWTGFNGTSFTLGDSAITEDKFGNIGIGTTAPTSKLTIAGMIETTLGGYKFPDGTLQTTAGISSVFHDATLTGNGTSGSPLGIALGGVGTIHIANNSVTGAKIANGTVLRSLNGLFDNVTLASGPNITIIPSGNTLTIASSNSGGLTSVATNSTLAGNGTSGSPLGIALPLNLSGAGGAFPAPLVNIENTSLGGAGLRAVAGSNTGLGFGGAGVQSFGGGAESSNGGIGIASDGGASASGNGGRGVAALGGDSQSGRGGAGVDAAGGNSASDEGGVGVMAVGGKSASAMSGGTGVRALGRESVSGIGGFGVQAFAGGSSSGPGGTGVSARGGNSESESDPAGAGVSAVGGNSTSSNGGLGVQAIGGLSSSGEGGFGADIRGGPSTNGLGGVGIVVFPGTGPLGTGAAAVFHGAVTVFGDLNVAGTKNFKIDHPLDPENKYLIHAAIESSEVLNVYSGNVVTDANGKASVALPEWFESLNKDLRYQLTVIGTFAQAIVGEKVKSNRFIIKTNAPNVEVSWQVTGVRSDAAMRKHPFKVEQDKPETERGFYLSPDAFDQPEEKGVESARQREMMKQTKETNQKRAQQ